VQRFWAVLVLNGIRVQVLAWVLALMLVLEVGVSRLDTFQGDQHFAMYVVPIRID
jgi:hypothetical protein